jgi:hypothetical protein
MYGSHNESKRGSVEGIAAQQEGLRRRIGGTDEGKLYSLYICWKG